MMARRGRTLTEADKTIFEAIYNQAEQLKIKSVCLRKQIKHKSLCK